MVCGSTKMDSTVGAIFSHVLSPPDHVAKKVVGLMVEFFLSKPKPISLTSSSTIESYWVSTIFPSIPPIFHPHFQTRSSWQLHEDSMFLHWRNEQQTHILYFDEASKGNPRVAGAGGVIIFP
jgi:hypothetical protein